MSVKLKNEDSTLRARFQNFIGHGKTRQLEIDASPSECLNWVTSFKGNPQSNWVSVETQAVKRPYQFTVHITSRGYRYYMELGVVIGDVIQSPMSESKSIVTLRFYHTIGSVLSGFITGAILFGAGVVMIIWGLDTITPPTSSRFPVESFLCLGGIGVFFIGGGGYGLIKLLSGQQPLEMARAHLLKLNRGQQTTLLP